MSRSLNKVSLIGNVGSDPEVRATSTGTRVAKLSVATNDYQGPDRDDKTNWHRLTFFGRLVDVVEQYVKKGDRIYVEGRLDYSTTEDDRGNTRYWTDIIVREMIMLGGGSGGGGGDFDQSAGRTSSGSSTTTPVSEADDDLPF